MLDDIKNKGLLVQRPGYCKVCNSRVGVRFTSSGAVHRKEVGRMNWLRRQAADLKHCVSKENTKSSTALR